MDDQFDILAAKVLSGEATAEESARLQEMLAGNAELRAEFEDLKSTWALMKESAPLAEALCAPPSAPPPERRDDWHRAVAAKRSETEAVQSGAKESLLSRIANIARRFFPRVALATALTGVIGATVLLWSRRDGSNSSATIAYLLVEQGSAELKRDGKVLSIHSVSFLRAGDEVRVPARTSVTLVRPNGAEEIVGPRTIRKRELSGRSLAPADGAQTNAALFKLHAAMFRAPEEMPALLVTMRSSQGIPVFSPQGFTADLTPPIWWRSEPGKVYDVFIMDEFLRNGSPLLRTNATPPLEFSNAWPGRALAPDGLYRLRIVESARPTTAMELTFRTLRAAPPATDGSASGRAYRILAANRSQLGDALAALLAAPPEEANSELALRLKLLVFGQLGYEEEFAAALSQLKAGAQR